MEKIVEINGVTNVRCEEDMKYYPLIIEDEEKGLTYTLDTEMFVYFPNLTVRQDDRYIGIWGNRRKRYLEKSKPLLYLQMFDEGSLVDHLIEINEQAEERMDMLEASMAESEGVTEELKDEDQMEWVRRMNSIISRAEEIVYNDLIYA